MNKSCTMTRTIKRRNSSAHRNTPKTFKSDILSSITSSQSRRYSSSHSESDDDDYMDEELPLKTGRIIDYLEDG